MKTPKTTKIRTGSAREKKIAETAKSVHHFELVYRAPFEAYDDIEGAIAAAGRFDVFIGWSEGAYRLGFAREAPSFRAALISAIADVECLGLDLVLVDVELQDNEAA